MGAGGDPLRALDRSGAAPGEHPGRDPAPRHDPGAGSPEASRPDLPRALSDVIRRCLEKIPAHRFHSAGELLAALQPFVSDTGDAPPSEREEDDLRANATTCRVPAEGACTLGRTALAQGKVRRTATLAAAWVRRAGDARRRGTAAPRGGGGRGRRPAALPRRRRGAEGGVRKGTDEGRVSRAPHGAARMALSGVRRLKATEKAGTTRPWAGRRRSKIFGRIERAEIDVRPLMLLIGDNNTGKSYLASLLWSIVAMQMELPLSVCSEYKACHAWAAEHIAPGKSPLDCVLTLEEVRMFAVLFEQAIAAGASDLMTNLPRPGAEGWAVSFHASCTGPVRLRWSTGPAPDRHTLQIDDPGPKNLTTHTGGTYEDVCALAVDMLARRISSSAR